MPQLKVQGRSYEWPEPQTITYREARMVREYLDVSVMNIINDLRLGRASEETLLAMFLIAKKRQDGSFDFDKVMELTLDDIDFVADPQPDQEGGDPADPPQPAAEPAAEGPTPVDSPSD